MDYIFQTETIHDLNLHREFTRGFNSASLPRNILHIITCLVLLGYMTMFHSTFVVYLYLILALFWFCLQLFQNRKSGDIHYQRMLQTHNGSPQHLTISVCEDCIYCVDNLTGNKYVYQYDMFNSVINTSNLLILTTKLRSCLILEKRWLKGGGIEELLSFLFQKCNNIKRKIVRKTTFGKWVHCILFTILILGALLAMGNLPSVPIWDRITGKLHNDMSYREMAEELVPLGINISEQTISELETYDAEYFAEYGNYYDVNYESSKILDLLCWEGIGTYDEESYEWTPSQSGIYCFDCEFWSVGTMYTDFFTGLSNINKNLTITNVQEDSSGVDWENGTGMILLSFDLNGNHYCLEAECCYDWFDSNVLFEIVRILASDDDTNDLYFAEDGGQGYVLYYGGSDQVRFLERKTGLNFHNTPNSIFLH